MENKNKLIKEVEDFIDQLENKYYGIGEKNAIIISVVAMDKDDIKNGTYTPYVNISGDKLALKVAAEELQDVVEMSNFQEFIKPSTDNN